MSKTKSITLQIWSQYFTLAVAFLTQPCLQLETFSEAKREKITTRFADLSFTFHCFERRHRRHVIVFLIAPSIIYVLFFRYGDMRVLMGFQILTMWSSLGMYSVLCPASWTLRLKPWFPLGLGLCFFFFRRFSRGLSRQSMLKYTQDWRQIQTASTNQKFLHLCSNGGCRFQ